MYQYTYASPVGELLLVGTEAVLTGLYVKGHALAPDVTDMEEKYTGSFEVATMWLDRYFAGQKPIMMPPMELNGTPFQKRVWHKLLMIPYGETTTYSALGEAIAKDMGKDSFSAQAIGGAVGKNPISIIIPCHRVIGKNGSLTGYAWGIDMKQSLLELEGVTIPENGKKI